MDEKKTLPVMSVKDVMDEYDRKAALPVTDPEHTDGFEWDEEHQGWCIWWGRYEYFVEDARIKTPENLIGWAVHVGQKSWEDSSSERLANWIEAVANKRGWSLAC